MKLIKNPSEPMNIFNPVTGEIIDDVIDTDLLDVPQKDIIMRMFVEGYLMEEQ